MTSARWWTILGTGLVLAACGPEAAPDPHDPTTLEAALPEVVEALGRGDPEAALAAIEELTRRDAAPAGIEHFEGLAHADAGRPGPAARAFEQEVALRPGNGQAHVFLAEALLDLGELDRAEVHLARGRDLLPGFGFAQLVAGRLALSRDDDELAYRRFRDYLAIDGSSSRAAECHAALAQIERRRGRLPQAEAHEERSQYLEQVHQFLSRYRARLAVAPDDAEAMLGVALTYLSLARELGEGRFLGDAEQAFTATLNLDPDNTKALFDMGYLRSLQDRHEEAEALYRRVTEVEPGHVGARFNLARLLALRSRLDEALVVLDEALEVAESADDRGRSHFERGQLLEEAGLVELAMEAYEASLAEVPGDPMDLTTHLEALRSRLNASRLTERDG